MYNTYILGHDDFCSKSKYSSKKHQEQIEDWSAWAEKNLTEKRKREIKRALKKM